jgi:hypothetical protein
MPSQISGNNRWIRFLNNEMDVKSFAKTLRGWPQAQLAELIAELVEILRQKQTDKKNQK